MLLGCCGEVSLDLIVVTSIRVGVGVVRIFLFGFVEDAQYVRPLLEASVKDRHAGLRRGRGCQRVRLLEFGQAFFVAAQTLVMSSPNRPACGCCACPLVRRLQSKVRLWRIGFSRSRHAPVGSWARFARRLGYSVFPQEDRITPELVALEGESRATYQNRDAGPGSLRNGDASRTSSATRVRPRNGR